MEFTLNIYGCDKPQNFVEFTSKDIQDDSTFIRNTTLGLSLLLILV